MKKTYEVHVDANALRTIKVRAQSGREALDIAVGRIPESIGPWVLDFPGGEDEHFTVELENTIIGPYSQGDFADEAVTG